jgi:translation initiation factor IF-2
MDKSEKTEVNNLRPPIVAVLGHVDHGKTTLLDAIRKTSVTEREAGGITQSIGASVVATKDGKKITFIDTPGHAAFKNMRKFGAKAADIAILVVAAEEGVKPQTKEALEYILDAGIPYIVAATKVDLPSASIEILQGQLEKEGVMFEGKGGDTPLIGLSARKGEGIENLLEMIALVAEVNGIKGREDAELEAFVIETSKDKRGPLVSVIVRNGTLRVGDEIVTQTVSAKVRGLIDDKGKAIKSVYPGEPAQIMGFNKFPDVGSVVWHSNDAKQAIAVKQEKPIYRKAKEGEVLVIVKAGNTGALEAIVSNLPKEAITVSTGVGEVNQSDVFLAKSTKSTIFAFESKVPPYVSKLADTEGVKIFSYSIIYELFEKLEKIIKEGIVEIRGEAQILAEFPYSNTRVAGSKVAKGNITKSDSITIMRGDKMIGKARVISIRKQKQEVNQVGQGEECGIIFAPQLDFEIGDTIVSKKEK